MSEKNRKKLTNVELSEIFGQFFLIQKAGISIYEGTTILAKENEVEKEIEVYKKLGNALETESYLFKAMEMTGSFPEYSIALIRIGELTGRLDDALTYLEKHYTREEDISRTIRGTILFPAIIAVMMLVVIIVLLTIVMPVFNQVYAQLGTDMTGLAKTFMEIGQDINKWGFIVLIVIVVAIVAAFIISRFPFGKDFFTKTAFKIGITRKTKTMRAVSRLAMGLSVGLRSGLDITESFSLAAMLITEPTIKQVIDEAAKKLDLGESPEKVLIDTGLFNGVSMRMISVGMKTGTAAQVFEEIADSAREEMYTHMNNVLAVVEPVVVVALSIIVGIILGSVMLPLVGIISGI